MRTKDYKIWRDNLIESRKGKKVISIEEGCPDCNNDPTDDSLHRKECRRAIEFNDSREYLQYGPPWYEWIEEMGKEKDETAKDKMDPGKNPRELTKKEADKLLDKVIRRDENE